MENRKILVSLVAVIALALLIVNVSAFGGFQSIELKGVEALGGADIAVFAGETIPVRVTFDATGDAEDVRVKVWISGAKDLSFSSERFDVLAGRTYSRLVSVKVPFDIDPSEDLELRISVESKNSGSIGPVELNLATQRESYIVEILDVFTDTKVKAGSSLALDIVLKNRGRQFAEDTFVRVSVPALGIERRTFFGDLAPLDQSDPDKEDAVERRMLLEIPARTPSGVYLVEVEAFNADSSTTVSKKVLVVGANEDSLVVPAVSSKTVAVNEKGTYSLTIVNSGNNVRVYELVFESSSGLKLEADEPVVAIPAGSSRTVKIMASADSAGKYPFAVNVNSDGELVKKESFVANVEGRAVANATVVLTVVLAIIFVVLLVVLIVLLTRKPQKSEEFGESYY